MTRILISACLLGHAVRYDHSHKQIHHPLIAQWHKEGRLIPICPEVSAGLPTPRPPAEIQPGYTGTDVLKQVALVQDTQLRDLSTAFIQGAELALKLALQHHIHIAILKENSPSCGSQTIYDGHFSGQKVSGMGVTAALLRQHQIHVFNEFQIDEVAALL